jgi:excinuclease ABC subunit A
VQRINLTTALGTSLVNTLFVLDEPSIGLLSARHGTRDRRDEALEAVGQLAARRRARSAGDAGGGSHLDIGPGRASRAARSCSSIGRRAAGRSAR